jgi:hypothetical protein
LCLGIAGLAKVLLENTGASRCRFGPDRLWTPSILLGRFSSILFGFFVVVIVFLMSLLGLLGSLFRVEELIQADALGCLLACILRVLIVI